MSRKCFIDSNISLSEADEAFINSLDLEINTFDENVVAPSEIEYYYYIVSYQMICY